MQYATTRSDLETYCAQQVLTQSVAADGGLFVPVELKTLSSGEVDSILNKSTPEILTEIVNYFFDSELNPKDVEFTIGKQITKLKSMNYRILVAECWRNLDGDFSRVERLLAKLLAQKKCDGPVGEWLKVVTRVGLLFCIFGKICREQKALFAEPVDVVVLSGDFTGPTAAWVARKMGLPIGNIVCCCNENDAVWELLQHGEMRTDLPVIRTDMPQCDISCPAGIERMIRMNLGLSEAQKFAFARDTGMTYNVGGEIRNLIPGIYVSVINSRRIPGVIANVYATNGYALCPYSAMLYAGLMDYRANTGFNGQGLIISESSPAQCEDAMVRALGSAAARFPQRTDLI